MLAQSSSAEVFYDKIRHELRVTSVHHCDSLKSLGRIIGAVTVAFLEEAPKYKNDECDDGDEVQSSDQVTQCLLDRSKVWGDIPASLSLIPMPGAPHPHRPAQHYNRAESHTRETCPGSQHPVGRVYKEADHVDTQAKKNSDCEPISSPPQVRTGRNTSVQLPVSLREKKDERKDLLNLKDNVHAKRSSKSLSSQKVSATVSSVTSEDEWQMQSELDENKLSSPSVSNSIDPLWKLDVDGVRTHSPVLSSSHDRDVVVFTDTETFSEKSKHNPVVRTKEKSVVQQHLHKNIDTIRETPVMHASRKKDIENVVVKEEVFQDLCHSSGAAEVTAFDDDDEDDDNNGDESVDMIEEEYLDSEDAFLKEQDSGLSSSISSAYTQRQSRSSYPNPYPGLGETAFPGITSMNSTLSVPESLRTQSEYPFPVPSSAFGSHGYDPSGISSSVYRPSTTLLPQYQSSSSLLHMKSQAKKSHRKVPTCAVCYAEIRDKNDFGAHVSLHSLDDQHNCPICLKIFSNRANLLRHSGLHILGVLYQCPICCKMIKRGDNFQVHMRKQHPGQSVKMAKIVSQFGQDKLSKSFYASTRSVSTEDTFPWFGRSSDAVKLEPGTSTGRSRFLSERDDVCGTPVNRNRTLADSSSERESLDLSLHPRSCPFCVNTFSSASLAHHIKEVHGEFNLGRSSADND